MRHLGEEHRAEFSGADQRDADGFSRGMAGGEEAMQISLPRLPGGRAPSLKEYQERLRSVNGLKVKARAKARSGLSLHALEPRAGGEIKQTKPPHPQPLSPRGEREKTATHRLRCAFSASANSAASSLPSPSLSKRFTIDFTSLAKSAL